MQLWGLQYKKDMDLLEWEENHQDDQVAGAPLLWDNLRGQRMVSMKKKKLWGDPIAPKEAYKKNWRGTFPKSMQELDKEEWL